LEIRRLAEAWKALLATTTSEGDRLKQVLSETQAYWHSVLAARGAKVLDDFLANVVLSTEKAIQLTREKPLDSLVMDLQAAPITIERAEVLFKTVVHANSLRLDAEANTQKQNEDAWALLNNLAVASRSAGVVEVTHMENVRGRYNEQQRTWNESVAPQLATLAAMSAAWRRYKPSESKKKNAAAVLASRLVQTFAPEAIQQILKLVVDGKTPYYATVKEKPSGSGSSGAVTAPLQM
jgi:hypothetical protein